MSEILEIINQDLLPGGSEKQILEMLIKKNNLTNCKIYVDTATQKGDNYVGIIIKVTIVGKNETTGEEKLNFIFKMSIRNEALHKRFPYNKLFDREIFMYQTMLPLFRELQISNNAKSIFNNYPTFHNASSIFMDEYIVMEDMKAKGFIMKDRKIPLDYNHCKIVFSQLGKYHSVSYAMKKYKPDLFKGYTDKLTNFMVEILNEDFTNCYDKMIRKSINSLDPVNDSKEYEAYQKFIDEHAVRFMEKIWKSIAADEYAVIIHGDCWSNNILYKYDDLDQPNKPTDVCFLDWQISHYNSPIIDICYFIYTCTDETVLMNHFDDLIQIYYDNLSRSLREMDCDPEEMFPFRILEEHCRKYFKYGVAIASNLLHLFTSEVDEIPDFSETTEFTKEELDKWVYESKNISLYYSRMRGIIRHAVSKGFI